MPAKVFKLLLPLAILAGSLSVAVLLIWTRPEAKPVEFTEKAWLVRAQVVGPQTWAPNLTLYGRIESLWTSELRAGVAADVEQVLVLEGDDVDTGQLLVALDERDARLLLKQREAELAQAEARIESELTMHAGDMAALSRERQLLRLAEAEVNRLTDLVKRKVGAQTQLDTARQAVERQAIALRTRDARVKEHKARLAELEASVSRAEALRDQAQLELDRCRIAAPFRGRIASLSVSPGRRVRQGDPLLVIYDTNALVVRAQIPSRYLPAVRDAQRAGQSLTVSGDIDGQPVRAELLRIAGEVKGATGGIEGLFKVQGDVYLQQGRFVRMDLSLPARDGLFALPSEAVYGADRVYRIDEESRLRPVVVTPVGEVVKAGGERLVLVEADLPAGSRVLATQLPNAIDGLLVREAQ